MFNKIISLLIDNIVLTPTIKYFQHLVTILLDTDDSWSSNYKTSEIMYKLGTKIWGSWRDTFKPNRNSCFISNMINTYFSDKTQVRLQPNGVLIISTS